MKLVVWRRKRRGDAFTPRRRRRWQCRIESTTSGRWTFRTIALMTGRALHTLSVEDVYTRELLVIPARGVARNCFSSFGSISPSSQGMGTDGFVTSSDGTRIAFTRLGSGPPVII